MASTSVDPSEHGERADPARRPAAAFAEQLRALREQAGSPSYRDLARRTHFSASTLAEAVSGRRLPSVAVVRALATAYGANPDEWATKLARAAENARRSDHETASNQDSQYGSQRDVREHGIEPSHASRIDTSDGRGRSRQTPLRLLWARFPRNRIWKATASSAQRFRRVPRWLGETVGAVLLLVAGGSIGAAAAAAAGSDPVVPAPTGSTAVAVAAAAPSQTPQPATDGQDPVAAGCAGDARVLNRADVIHNRVHIGVVELKYSNLCAAGWARVYLTDGTPSMFGTVTIAAGDGTAVSLTMFIRDSGPRGAIYTDVLTAHNGCLSASAELEPVVPQRVSAVTACTQP
jgi:transcriptional regulator with XRE-family HTH domain